MKATVVAVSLVLLSGTGLLAHHSPGLFYDLCTSVTIEGMVEGIQWKNPHTLIDVKTNEGAAFRAEWTSLLHLANTGVASPARDALSVGDRVVVTGNPALVRASVPASKEPAEKMVVLNQIRRASDGWSWTRPPEPTPQGCAQK